MRNKATALVFTLAMLSAPLSADELTLQAMLSAGVQLTPAQQTAVASANAGQLAGVVATLVQGKEDDAAAVQAIIRAAVQGASSRNIRNIVYRSVLASKKSAQSIVAAAVTVAPTRERTIVSAAKRAAPRQIAAINIGASQGRQAAQQLALANTPQDDTTRSTSNDTTAAGPGAGVGYGGGSRSGSISPGGSLGGGGGGGGTNTNVGSPN